MRRVFATCSTRSSLLVPGKGNLISGLIRRLTIYDMGALAAGCLGSSEVGNGLRCGAEKATAPLARDLEPDNLALRSAFGSPIGSEPFDHGEPAFVGLIARERTNRRLAWSLVFDLDSHPMG